MQSFNLTTPGCPFLNIGVHMNPKTQQASQGKPGCRNIRKGGDSVGHDTSAAYVTYMVYRSFKHKPAWSTCFDFMFPLV
jgi:hypothetical protein